MNNYMPLLPVFYRSSPLESWGKMFRFKQKNLPRLLRQAFREEAREVKLPSRQQLWIELQQRPEFAAIAKNAKQLEPQSKPQNSAGKKLYVLYKKHLHLTGFIAAGLLLALLLTRPAFFMRQADPHPPEQIHATGETSLVGQDLAEKRDGAALSAGNEDEMADQEMMLPAAGAEENLQAEDALPPPAAPEAYSFQAEEEQSPLPEKHLRDSHPGRSLGPVSREEAFVDEESFLQALKEARLLTDEEMWQVKSKSLPESFDFLEGTITRSEETFLQISQVFAGKKGNKFTLTQWFTPEKIKNETDADPDPAIAQGPAQPMQVGPYRGYLYCPCPENYTLTWLQEKSFVTLSGQLTEEMLHQILAALENFQGIQ